MSSNRSQSKPQVTSMQPTKKQRIDQPKLWSRDDIVSCLCSESNSRHVHCPCSICNGAAVARSVEYLHWRFKQQQEIDELVITG